MDTEKVDHSTQPITSPLSSPTYESPFEFPLWKKWLITITGALLTFTSTFCSSIFSSAVEVTTVEFNVSETVSLLAVSLYVLGFGLGPILWGPWSEVSGRKIPLFTGYTLFALMQIPVALSPTFTGVLISRFLSGCFAAAPVALVSAMYADFWPPAERGVASAVYSVAAFAGPTCGPIVGSFIVASHLGWRWTAWIVFIFAGAMGPVAFLSIPETYGPTLEKRAMRKTCMNNELGMVLSRTRSAVSLQASKHFFTKFLLKPMIILVHEPMLIVMTLYISAAYGLIYLTFYAFPFNFTTTRGWHPTIGSLPFLSMLVGILVSCYAVALYSKYYYSPRLRKRRGQVRPEDRLPPIMLGGIILPISLFWFAWTSDPHIIWVPQVISAFFIGSGIMLIFTNGIAFIIDVYLTNAASAMAANTSIRSMVAAGLPLAGPSMYRNLGNQWATSTLALICVVLVPAPFVFYVYGERLRAKSRYAVVSKPH